MAISESCAFALLEADREMLVFVKIKFREIGFQ